MSDICKFSYDIKDILKNNNWNNKFNFISCIDNDTFYILNLFFNETKLEFITDFNTYCVCDKLNDINYSFLCLNNYSPKTILKTLDNFNNNKNIINFTDEFNFYQTFKQNSKFDLNYTELKIQSKKFSKNIKNLININIPKELLFNENQIYTILINEITKINTNNTFKHYIYPFENNIYDLRTKIFFDNNIELELKFFIDPKLFPFYPPKIEVITPKLSIPLLLAIINLNVCKIENWNYAITFEWLITNIFNVLNPIIQKHVLHDNNYNSLEKLLIKLSHLTKEYNIDDINIDIKINKFQFKNNNKNYWKSGTGYGNKYAVKWDIKNYILEKESLDQEITILLENIFNYINKENIKTIANSSLINYLINKTNGITLLDINSSKNIFEIIMKILDGLFDFKNELDLIFFKTIVNNLCNINSEILLLFENNEEFKMDFLYQSIHINYEKFSSIITFENKNNDQTIQNNDQTIQNNDQTIQNNDQTIQNKYINIMKELQFNDNANINDKHRFFNNVKCNLDSKAIIRIISELSTLKTSLPLNYDSTIWMRISNKILHLFTFMISGPKDTPYENGLFIFHAYFPSTYPNKEPGVLIDTTGMNTVRFNPNLYSNGKVCLSLLGTWAGEQGENWNSKTSSFLQVLVSIQSLIFVDQPYFNEPGYEIELGTDIGNKHSDDYNEQIFFHTIELAMIDQIKNGPSEYKDVIINHFKIKKDDIFNTCEKWINKSTKYKQQITDAYNKLKELLNQF